LKLKLDENLGTKSAQLFRLAGHDTVTVPEQDLCSATDKELLAVCVDEQRCIVTLDLDFGNPLLFRPGDYEGIAVLRLPNKPTPEDLLNTVGTLIGGLRDSEIKGKLWIVQSGRIREYQPTES
jgi:predicted nuclease of predicted toxin-antitoxin system